MDWISIQRLLEPELTSAIYWVCRCAIQIPPLVASQNGDPEEPEDQDVDVQEDRQRAALVREGGGEGGRQDRRHEGEGRRPL